MSNKFGLVPYKIRRWAVQSKIIRPMLDIYGVTLKERRPHTLPVVRKIEKPEIKFDGLKGFELLGSNWLKANAAENIAILWKFNPWKRDFCARYLPEFRTAFARGKSHKFFLNYRLGRHKSLSFIIWGKTEPKKIASYALKKEIPIYRMEDGFIRSAALGSSHTLPLSLVLDKRGIYFDANEPSDIEELYEKYDFSSDPQLMENTRALMRLVRQLRVSKYNLGSIHNPKVVLGPHLKRRVLVLGQVEDDASILFGMAKGWTNKRLVELAREENPDAEIYYKPHPDVMKGYRKGSQHDLEELCTILEQEFVLGDLFIAVDHIYTITSLSGFEALLYGLSVTVVGAPFYSGWGLTDDRVSIERRTRKLSLEELFCGAYLLYPRYLADLEDSVYGALATILRVVADREYLMIEKFSDNIGTKDMELIIGTEYWPVLLRSSYMTNVIGRYGRRVFNALSIPDIFSRCHGEHYQRSMAYVLVGIFKSTKIADRLLVLLRANVRVEVFKSLIEDLWHISPDEKLLSHWAWILEKGKENTEARNTLYHHIKDREYTGPSEEDLIIVSKAEYKNMLSVAQFELRHRNLDQACHLFNRLLISGHVYGEVFAGLAEIARLKFDFASAAHLMAFFNKYDPFWKAGRGHVMEAQAQSLVGNAVRTILSMSLACKFDTKFVESVPSVERVLISGFGELPYVDGMMRAFEVDESGSGIGRARALISADQSEEAENLLCSYNPEPGEFVNYGILLSSAMSYQGKHSDAKEVITNLLQICPTILVYREGLRIAIRKNDYGWGKQLLDEAVDRGFDVGDIYHRKIALGLRDIRGGYLSFRKIRARNTLIPYLEKHYVESLDELASGKAARNVVIAFFGPGDEIRFASFYESFQARCPESKLLFTCDPRLQKLLERHYVDLNFVPVKRLRSFVGISDYSQYSEMPGSDLHVFFDNAGWKLASEADNVILTTDALGDVVENYDSFKGTSYLRAAPEEVKAWKNILPTSSGKRLIGLSWRSSLTTFSRNEHYLSVEELAPLFELDNIQFINLQYDECNDELAWIEKNYPGKMINYPDLDQFDDLDGVAALMCALDLIITPATTIVELAGALGCPTLLLSNSSELHWRKLPDTNIDVWHNSITHIEGQKLGDKASLVNELVNFLNNNQLSDNAMKTIEKV